MNTCPCCSYPLMRHIRSQSIYWFCKHCWQEMPNFAEVKAIPRELVTTYSQKQRVPHVLRDRWEPEISLSDKFFVEKRAKFENAKRSTKEDRCAVV